MDLPQEIDDFIKHAIDDTLCLPIPDSALQLKIQSLETSNHHLRSQCIAVQSRLEQKQDAINLARAEACLNAQSIKKFVEEKQNLEIKRTDLMGERWKIGRERYRKSLDREGLMNFKNESEERENVAEIRANELEEKLKKAGEELQLYKRRCEKFTVDSSEEGTSSEGILLNRLVASLASEIEVVKTARAFLEDNSGVEVCHKLLKMWNSLRPETQNILSMAAQLQSLEKDKEHLSINLHRAEEEVRVLFEENDVLDEENGRLLKLYDSAGNDSTTKSKKRKLNPEMMSSPVDKTMDFDDLGSLKHPLAPLKENSPTSKSRKNCQQQYQL